METAQFDASLGGSEHLPFAANSLKFAASRSVEIAAMAESILRPSTTKLIFQSLPVHMRRRVMSHNVKRLPRKLRTGHLEQMRKSGLPPKQKRPSRKHRRRPGNLLDEYNRRQKRIVWLETHIWHAKRFHMIERWGYKLANAPCDKAFRACYRASSTHCLLQDISYFTPIQISGTIENIKLLFSSLTIPSCGLGICAKAFTSGNREGTIHLYSSNSFPKGYIGKINFVWIKNDSVNRTLYLFVHPSQVAQVESTFSKLLCNEAKSEPLLEPTKTTEKRRKLTNTLSESIQMKVLFGTFNRFRLTGPNSQAILAHCLKCVDSIPSNKWVSSLDKNTQLHLKEKHEYWQSISKAGSPSQLPPNLVIGLVVRDPRLSRPSKRTKAQSRNGNKINTDTLVHIPHHASESPLWDTKIHETIKSNRMTNGQFIEHITKTQLVPGEVFLEDPKVQCVPVVLIQRPGSQDPTYKKLGYGSGWDIIVPSGYGLAFWQTFIMYGGRSGGLRETESVAFEMGQCYIPPDSHAGKEEEKRIETEIRERYFKLPPSKRVNYIKLGVNSPFICPWKMILKDWCGKTIDDFYVLRDSKLLDVLQGCISRKANIPQIEEAENCLVAVYIQIQGKGSLKRHTMICLPQQGDINNIKELLEPNHEDPNEKLRKIKKRQHIKNIKKWRRKRIKLKKKGVAVETNQTQKQNNTNKREPSEFVKAMRELWLPSKISSVRHSNSREILGYLSQGAFTFTEAKSCGVGYLPYNALKELLKSNHNQVLIRNTSSRKYRIANLYIVKNT